MQALILATYNPNLKIIIKTNASDFALGACLSQKHDRKLRPIAYHSQMFLPAKLNYDVHDKKLLAMG